MGSVTPPMADFFDCRGRSIHRGVEAVAHLAHGDDVAAVGTQLAAQALDMGVHGADVAGVTQLPDAAQQLAAGEDRVRVAHQVGEELEFPGGEHQRGAVDNDLAAAAVQDHPAAADGVLLRGKGVVHLQQLAGEVDRRHGTRPGGGDGDGKPHDPLIQVLQLVRGSDAEPRACQTGSYKVVDLVRLVRGKFLTVFSHREISSHTHLIQKGSVSVLDEHAVRTGRRYLLLRNNQGRSNGQAYHTHII